MNVSYLLTNLGKHVKINSPEILTALGVTGVLTTSYLTAKAAFRASDVIRREEAIGGTNDDTKERFKERAKLTWKLYIPPAISGVTTVACVVGSSRVSGRRAAAAVTAFSVTEKAFTEYKEKVVEQIGANKEQKIRDEIVQEKVQRESGKQEVVIAGTGHVLCCELYTGRYFRSDMETLRRAQNDINEKIVNELYVSLDRLYDILGLAYTSQSNHLGWTSDKLMAFEFTTALTDSGEPCLAFAYNYVKPL